MTSTELLLRSVGKQTKARVSNFGIELEVLQEGYGATSYANAFVKHGLMDASDTGKHSYHCHCNRCRYDRDSPHFTMQSDPTVGAEFISRILNCDRDHEIVHAAVQAHEDGMKASHWRPDGYDNNGNHIHISRRGTDDPKSERPFEDQTFDQAMALIASLLAIGSWDMAAAGGCDRLRSYNGQKPDKTQGEEFYNERTGRWGRRPRQAKALSPVYSSWLCNKGNTLEFRLWNTPRKAERVKAHVGLSLAILRWAYTQVVFDRAALAELDHSAAEAMLSVRLDDLKEVLLDACPGPFRESAADALEELVAT